MFYRELQFPLERIKAVINKKGFDMVKALENHRKMLIDRNERTKKLVTTIDKTIRKIREEMPVLKDEDLYEGFSRKEIKEIAKEVEEKYDPKVVKESYANVRKMTKEQFAAVKKEGEDIAAGLAAVMDKDPGSKEVQALIERHFKHLHNYYKPTIEMYRGLGNMYVSDQRFTAYYDKYKKGLAIFIDKAIGIFCGRKKG
jgi:DNA-binding transcriptional MerR regulator